MCVPSSARSETLDWRKPRYARVHLVIFISQAHSVCNPVVFGCPGACHPKIIPLMMLQTSFVFCFVFVGSGGMPVPIEPEGGSLLLGLAIQQWTRSTGG